MHEKSKETEGDFGAGFAYNLFLFAKHWGLIQNFLESHRRANLPENWAYNLWFFGASDHLIDLNVPKTFKGTKVERFVNRLKEKCSSSIFHFTKTNPRGSFEEVFSDLEEIFISIDKKLGINVKKAKDK